MDNMDKKQCGDMCGGGMCGGCGGMEQMHGCHGGKHHLMKMLLKIVIVILIFWAGFNLGQITGFIRAQYGGYGMMRGNYYNNMPINGGVVTP